MLRMAHFRNGGSILASKVGASCGCGAAEPNTIWTSIASSAATESNSKTQGTLSCCAGTKASHCSPVQTCCMQEKKIHRPVSWKCSSQTFRGTQRTRYKCPLGRSARLALVWPNSLLAVGVDGREELELLRSFEIAEARVETTVSHAPLQFQDDESDAAVPKSNNACPKTAWKGAPDSRQHLKATTSSTDIPLKRTSFASFWAQAHTSTSSRCDRILSCFCRRA
mmetsp:Transcript_62382/g.115798  ORF Transcript_62382/g.115798 Transcript_62382/m.115798 type:complete len:224 (+) Transcript_62382:1667-2338(+)